MSDDVLIQQAIDLAHTSAHYPRESVVIFGASFNPVTQGHLGLIRTLLADPILKDKPIYLIPAPFYIGKQDYFSCACVGTISQDILKATHTNHSNCLCS